MKAIITVGISTSGKSTLAAEMVEQGYTEINRDFIRFNIVKLGADWRNYKFSRQNEQLVTDIHGKMIMEAWTRGDNIIVSDTNLHAPTRNRLIGHLRDLGYEVEVKALPIALEEAWKRDTYRTNGVGHSVIYQQHQKWNEFVGRRTYVPDPSKRTAIIVDVDGTIAEMNGRGPFDWHRVGEDKPRQEIIDMVNAMNYYHGHVMIVVSGRSDECRQETLDWMDQHDVNYAYLHMRKAGDYRKDSEVKEEIFWEHIADNYNVVAVVDDRPMMLRRWYDLKMPNVICVGNPYTEF